MIQILLGITDLNEDSDLDEHGFDDGQEFGTVFRFKLNTFSEPQAVPLQALGIINVGATHVGDSEMLAHALANTLLKATETSFVIKCSGDFVNEYPRTGTDGEQTDGGCEDPNHFCGAFPTSYCYRKGAPEVNRLVDVPYNTHI